MLCPARIRTGWRQFATSAALLTMLTAACRDSTSPFPALPATGVPTPTGDLLLTSATTRDIAANGRRLDVLGDPAPPPRTRYRTEHHGGPLLTTNQNVYVIYYGNWPDLNRAPSATQTIITDFLTSIGNTPYLRTLRRYTDATGAPAASVIIYGGAVADGFSRGATLGDTDAPQIISDQVNEFLLPQDPDGIYLLLLSPEVTDTTGLFVTYCARHGRGLVNGNFVRYVVVGNPLRAPFRCAPQAVGPNGTLDGDAIVSHLAAELANTFTDPNLDGWYDRLGLEPADKCVWNFGTPYRTANGAAANVRIGSRDYLLQQLWAPSKNGGSCVLSS